jgi:hypothetical protein
MKNESYIIYVLGTIIGFLAFAFSMNYVDSNPIFIIVGIGGMTGMSHCVTKLVNFHSRSR